MNGFLKWFKSSTKMKRWLLMILVGVILACYGIAKILVTKEMGFVELAQIAGAFVVGFTCIVLGFIFTQKRTLELLVQESDTREQAKEEKVKSLIFNKKVYNQGPNVVVIGGGSGLNTVLKGLKHYTDNITAIVTVSDYGAKISDSRKILETLPLDDVKESLVALSYDEAAMEGLLNLKFGQGKLESLSFGDIYLEAMHELTGDFTKSIEGAKKVLNITGKVLPVTLEEIKICAELEDGTVIEDRAKIPEVVSSKISKINRIYISPTNCKAAPGVLEAISEADAVIIGPGSLYTNVIPNLLVKGVAKAMKECQGFKIYISNVMTEPGQTDNYKLSDHIKAINEHVGSGVIDYCIYDTGEIVPEFVRKYNMQGSELVEADVSKAKSEGIHLMQRNLSTVVGEHIRHNPDAIASSIIELICEDLKFKDMQNDAQYMMLNSKLKTTKKQLKKKGKEESKQIKESKEKQERTRKGNSKFFSKYQERIASIQGSEETTAKNREKVKKAERAEEIKRQDSKEKKQNISNKNKKNRKNVSKMTASTNETVKKKKQVNELEEEEKKKFIDAVNHMRK